MQTMAIRARSAAHSELGWSVAIVAVCAVLLLVAPGKVVNGLLLGSMIALGAIGITLIYSILRFAHIAHGDYMTLGAYITLFLLTVALPAPGHRRRGLRPLHLWLPAADCPAHNRRRLLRPRRRNRLFGVRASARARHWPSNSLNGVARHRHSRQGRDTDALGHRTVATSARNRDPFYHLDFEIALPTGGALPFDIRIPPDNIFLGLTTVVLVGALYLFLNRTRIGKATRATSDNIDLARVTGINTTRIIHWTWVIAAAYAAIAGTLIAVSQAQMLPTSGWNTLIPMFAAVTLGGIGKPWGALVGGLLVGISMEASTEWVSPAYKPAVAFAIMLMVLLLRPRGLFGERDA